MAQLNRIILIGKIVDQPDVKVSTEGKSIAKFTLEAERPFGEKTDKVTVVSWEKLADTVNEFGQGDMVLVEGRIQQRTFEADNGETVWVTEVVSSSLKAFAGGTVAGASSTTQEDTTEDDIPF